MKSCPVVAEDLGLDNGTVLKPARLGLAISRSDHMHDATRGSVELLAPEELSVLFQPIVDLSDGAIYGVEALVRCTRPEFRHPVVLFDNAHAWNCAPQLGRMIREIAVPLVRGQRLFVNLHPSELDENLLLRADDPIFAHDDDVVVELTEALPLANLERSVWVLRELRRRAGIELAIDDLGAGYSNLKVIADLEPKIVKLDRGLVDGLSRSARQQKLVSWLVRMCEDLGAQVVAEGVETEDDLRAVRDTGAKFAQGFLLGRPEPALAQSGMRPAARVR